MSCTIHANRKLFIKWDFSVCPLCPDVTGVFRGQHYPLMLIEDKNITYPCCNKPSIRIRQSENTCDLKYATDNVFFETDAHEQVLTPDIRKEAIIQILQTDY